MKISDRHVYMLPPTMLTVAGMKPPKNQDKNTGSEQ